MSSSSLAAQLLTFREGADYAGYVGQPAGNNMHPCPFQFQTYVIVDSTQQTAAVYQETESQQGLYLPFDRLVWRNL